MNFEENTFPVEEKQKPSRTWLLSFLDLISLILGFFVLLFSMRDMPAERFEEIKDSFVSYINGEKATKEYKFVNRPGSETVIRSAQSLNYVETLLKNSLYSDVSLNFEIKRERNFISIEFFEEYKSRKRFEESILPRVTALSKTLNSLSNQLEVVAYTGDINKDIAVADTNLKKEAMRLWRHQIPVKINEEYRHYWQQGGGKVGSDWWVPMDRLLVMMDYVYETGRQSGIPFLAFAHLGQGHPHVNYLCKTPEEKQKAELLLLDCCRKAVSLGGGVAGEHGIGKIHRDYLPIQWGASQIQKMRAIKSEYDPNWILGRGNILVYDNL